MEPIVKKGPFTKIPITKCGGNLYCAYYFIKKCLFKKMADYKKLLSLIVSLAGLELCSPRCKIVAEPEPSLFSWSRRS